MIESRAKLEQTLSLVITRADGTVEDLGVVAYWHRNPLKRFWWNVRQRIKGK